MIHVISGIVTALGLSIILDNESDPRSCRETRRMMALWVDHVVVYWGMCALLYFTRPPESRRSQTEEETRKWLAGASYSFLNQFFVHLPLTLFWARGMHTRFYAPPCGACTTYWCVLRPRHIPVDPLYGPDRSADPYELTSAIVYYVVTMVYLAILADLVFGVVHLLFHKIGCLYRLVHKTHHRYTRPVPTLALYCSPIEHVFCNIASVLLPCMFLEVPWVVMRAFTVMATINSVRAHHIINGSHWKHHQKLNVNFGAGMLLDRLLGTHV